MVIVIIKVIDVLLLWNGHLQRRRL